MKQELEKTYDPKAIEDRLYKKWQDGGYFSAKPQADKKPFTIVIPPPNITGQLHMGHALDNTIQDILIRFKRMQGYNALWQPGTDHASIATEVKIIEKLKEEGITKESLGREGFLKRAWEWKEEYGGRIVEQLKKLGTSCDWDRLRFTMDEGCSAAVKESFIRMYDRGHIYKGSKLINWCPVCHTTISDAEVEYEEQAGHLWRIKYPIKDTDAYLAFETTRPETMLGDTAVAVNPDDERYKSLIGKTLVMPFTGREIPVIADTYVESEFGTGVVKITPAHDPNDFEVGKRHNLPEINIMNDDGTINENGGVYARLDRYAARKQILKDLDALGLLVKTSDYTHNVGTHDRCGGTTIEPLIKKQWFVKMDELINPAANAVKNKEIQLLPESLEKLYFHWTDNIRDWCISRQLWWGHRIPAYICADCGEIAVSKDAVSVCPKCGSHKMVQDEDVLDTWFSSALWPFSTLGWPDETEDLKYFFPTDVLVTGYDIIFFWVIRMVFSSYEHMGQKPFSTVLFHGLIRDELGRKMSKSLGNGIDPLEIIDKYGADALRFTLVTGNAPGNDMRFSDVKVKASRNFANKIWNASRFIMMNMDDINEEKGSEDDNSSFYELTQADKWILSKLNTLTRDVTYNMEHFELGVAAQKIYDFVWDEFCDWYIEMVKPRLYGDGNNEGKAAALWTLKTVLSSALKLLHPYMPFVTEEIYGLLCPNEKSLMVSKWPIWDENRDYKNDCESVERIKDAVRGIRSIRTEMNVPPSKKFGVFIVSEQEKICKIFSEGSLFFGTLAGTADVTIQTDKSGIDSDAVSVVIEDAVIYIPFAELVDIKQEIARLEKERERLTKEISRVVGMLSNERFMSKAPAEKVAEERAKQEKYEGMLKMVEGRLAALG